MGWLRQRAYSHSSSRGLARQWLLDIYTRQTSSSTRHTAWEATDPNDLSTAELAHLIHGVVTDRERCRQRIAIDWYDTLPLSPETRVTRTTTESSSPVVGRFRELFGGRAPVMRAAIHHQTHIAASPNCGRPQLHTSRSNQGSPPPSRDEILLVFGCLPSVFSTLKTFS